MSKKLFLFDIDGTLVVMKRALTRQLLSSVFHEIYELNIAPESIGNLGGKTDRQVFMEICLAAGLDERRCLARMEEAHDLMSRKFEEVSLRENIELLPGVEKLITGLSGREDAVLGLLTGNIRQNAYGKLRPYGLDEYFAFGAFGCDHADRAELPPVALERANTLAGREYFTPRNTVIIGDTHLDIACGHAHDIPVLAVATGAMSMEELQTYSPDALLENFADFDRTTEVLFGITH